MSYTMTYVIRYESDADMPSLGELENYSGGELVESWGNNRVAELETKLMAEQLTFKPDYGTDAQKDLIVEQLETIKVLEAKVKELEGDLEGMHSAYDAAQSLADDLNESENTQ